jgi:hypothetical protein
MLSVLILAARRAIWISLTASAPLRRRSPSFPVLLLLVSQMLLF